jgi:hypothetical protein
MEKRGQLGVIEAKYAIIGFFIGLGLSVVLVYLGTKKILPFKIPVVCGAAFLNKKGQLGAIEAKYFFIGLLIGLIGGLALVYLGTIGVLPFKIPVC